MPQIFKIGSYIVYFWMNENDPLVPIHVYVAEGVPTSSAAKIWITRTARCLLCNNSSKIPAKKLNYIQGVIGARSKEIIQKITYYC
ncbi:MAG: DUF4160 domain-containing protein [Lachnospiraceae bacterium]|nr:DUF4160 domain-containing protein [Lachnospiraceae bacterium]